MAVDANTLQQWVGRSEWATDQVTLVPVRALSATLDRDPEGIQPGDPLPPLWHWLYFLSVHRQSKLGADGHSQRGGFLPPVPLPRRMWAGSRVQFYHSIRVGETLSRRSVISAVDHKEGSSGSLIFVTVGHEVSNPQGLALREEQDLVYRENPKPGDAALTPKAAPEPSTWQRNIRPDEVMLFRYSALTFNAHRIHYDRRYATTVEGYPGLVVHGPLIATLLLDLLQQNLTKAIVSEFVFRAVRPLFDAAAFSVCGRMAPDKSVDLWAQDAEGCLAMEATAKLA